MYLAHHNPNPARTPDRPVTWELCRRDGSTATFYGDSADFYYNQADAAYISEAFADLHSRLDGIVKEQWPDLTKDQQAYELAKKELGTADLQAVVRRAQEIKGEL